MKRDEEIRFVLGSRVRAYKGWSLKATCPRCRATRAVPLSQIPQDITIQEAKNRLRCHIHHIQGKCVVLVDTQERELMHL